MFLSDSTYESLTNQIVRFFSDSTLKTLNEAVLFPLRTHYLTQILTPYFGESSNVLDLGTSNGALAANIKRKLGATTTPEFTGCDVHIQPETFIPVVRYDGYTIPFPENHFDTVMIIDVLHHADSPRRVLEEAKRVARKNILIKDHYWVNSKDFTSLKFADYIGNQPYGIHLPYGFLTEENWHRMIHDLNLNVLESRKFRYNLIDPCRHILFDLRLD
ncbi:class I SAM-dependent methyltransferase [Candidatus Synechococcus calcipolaris G9]|uniref:Class I SAM-dependent methyltransferase n=1 Tax=Candidatus Synechococcus calcipolaris G9 TaxID=1497997 RepID=A0ABT6EZA1_9SYNE|nr:class I SAM-dependent methyltransferase [Candidatus Synechococcus calcipolaris]MDG2990934.1 class I SAM-dependent methyltransferase [Candidatus Synechococcus calcipolaris G9]